MFESIFSEQTGITAQEILICTLVSLLCGIIIAVVYGYEKGYSKSMLIALITLPSAVQIVIMMVNGNLGIGVAVMGAFSLVRFRSAPGSAEDITLIFLAMASGLASGVGYVFFSFAITLLLCFVIIFASVILKNLKCAEERRLSVTIPENLDYNGIFDDIFSEYTSRCKMLRVKTVGMGTMYEIQYLIRLKDTRREKRMIDDIRCRNGNLTVICARIPENDFVI